MTTQRTFKRRIRERMEKTGESYTAARRQLLTDWDPPVPEASLVRETGHGWGHWIDVLDGARGTHAEMARRLVAEHGVAGWWAQSITTGYERARGLRATGQRAGGVYTAEVTRTVNVPVQRLADGWAALAAELPLRARTGTRYDWGDTRVHVRFTAKGDAKSTINVVHERLAGAQDVVRQKTEWRERLIFLKQRLEMESDQV